MPIYDYSCTICRHIVEVIHRIDDAGPRFCPNCGAEGTMRKGFTTPAVHFKGSGWAKKDRSTSSSGKSSASKSAASADKPDGSGDKSEASAGKSEASADRSEAAVDRSRAAPVKHDPSPPAPASDGGT